MPLVGLGMRKMPPSQKIPIGEYGSRWKYKESNFSVEINPGGKLASIKITDISDRVFPKGDAKKIQSFKAVLQILTSKNNTDIAKVLASDMELYREKKHSFW